MGTTWSRDHRSAVMTLAAGLPLLWCAVAAQLRHEVTAATAALVLVVVVVGAATTGDRVAGMVAAASGGLWFDFFLTAPFHRLTIEDPDDIEITILMVLVGIAVTELALWGGREQAKASSREGYLEGLMATSQIVSAQFSAAALGEQVARHLTDLLGVDGCRFVAGGPVSPDLPILGPDGEVRARGSVVNVARDGLPTLGEIVLPVQHNGVVEGQFLITASTDVARPTREQRRVAVLLANQVGTTHTPPIVSS